MAGRFGSIWLAFNKVLNERKSACLVRILLVAVEFRLAAVDIDILNLQVKVQLKMLDNVIGVQLHVSSWSSPATRSLECPCMHLACSGVHLHGS